MTTLVLGPRPPELEALLERRHRLGLDLFDEVWEGVYHMVPGPGPLHAAFDQQLAELLGPLARAAGLVPVGPFNLGSSDNYRVPDRGLLRERWESTKFVPSAALVVEIVSPDDESWAKLDFYAKQGVEEVLIVDPAERTTTWRTCHEGAWVRALVSGVLGVDVADVLAEIGW